jgi:hypothetical protein
VGCDARLLPGEVRSVESQLHPARTLFPCAGEGRMRWSLLLRPSPRVPLSGRVPLLVVASIQVAPLISLMTKVGKLHSPLILIDQMKADQIGHVARPQSFCLRNTKGDAAQGDFLMRTEWCPKTPKLMFGGSLGANWRRVTALSACGLLASRASPLQGLGVPVLERRHPQCTLRPASPWVRPAKRTQGAPASRGAGGPPPSDRPLYSR